MHHKTNTCLDGCSGSSVDSIRSTSYGQRDCRRFEGDVRIYRHLCAELQETRKRKSSVSNRCRVKPLNNIFGWRCPHPTISSHNIPLWWYTVDHLFIFLSLLRPLIHHAGTPRPDRDHSGQIRISINGEKLQGVVTIPMIRSPLFMVTGCETTLRWEIRDGELWVLKTRTRLDLRLRQIMSEEKMHNSAAVWHVTTRDTHQTYTKH